MPAAALNLLDVTVRSGSFRLEQLRFEVEPGAYAVLQGASGSGKTTILEAICGLRSIDSGEIVIRDARVDHLPPAHRGIGYVPQDGALFPTMTALRQIALPFELRGHGRAEAERRAGELAVMVGVEHLLPRRPRGFSGGERQRVAIARALAREPDVLVMDEPMGALDDAMRSRVVESLQGVHRHSGVTVLHVTHDARDVRDLANRVLRLEGGAVRPD